MDFFLLPQQLQVLFFYYPNNCRSTSEPRLASNPHHGCGATVAPRRPGPVTAASCSRHAAPWEEEGEGWGETRGGDEGGGGGAWPWRRGGEGGRGAPRGGEDGSGVAELDLCMRATEDWASDGPVWLDRQSESPFAFMANVGPK